MENIPSLKYNFLWACKVHRASHTHEPRHRAFAVIKNKDQKLLPGKQNSRYLNHEKKLSGEQKKWISTRDPKLGEESVILEL